MTNRTELCNLISSLSEDNFRNLIKEFLKEKYNTSHVRIIDGPYDGGNDVEIIIGEKDIKKNIQITVQKNGFESKLEADLKKSSDNISQYAYLNQLDFYINQNVSKDKRNELERKAEINYGINLTIIDSNILSQESESYSSIRNFTYESHGIQIDTQSKFDKPTKILFDVLTLNKDIVEIKKSFIYSYIYSFLYANPNSNEDGIFQHINSQLNNSLEKNYIIKALNDLRMKKLIISPTDNKKIYYLSDEKSKEIDTIYSDVNSKEIELKNIINSFLNDKQIGVDSSDLIDFLYKLYQENYTIDIDEIQNTNTSFSASLKKSYTDLINYFRKKKISEDNANLYAKELLTLCSENDFLNKLSTIHLFNNLYYSNKLEKYINNKKQTILLDTQILIRLVCVLYDENYEFTDTALSSVKILYSTLNNFKNQVEIISTYDYLEEVANHLLEAIKLEKFFKLPFVNELGKSKNVFYNFYSELRKNDKIDDYVEFCDFINILLDEDIEFQSDNEFVQRVIRLLTDQLGMYNITFSQHQNYSNFQEIKKEYETNLAFQSKERTNKAIENDLRTLLYLSTAYNANSESFLVTWDSVFYGFRKKILNKFPQLKFWYIYSPLKVVDRLSVMNFNLNPKSINQNIIALTETNYNYSTKTNSFLDVISQFFNKENVNQDFIKKLNGLRKKTQDVANTNPVFDDFNDDEDGGNITKLLLRIRNRYHSYESKFNFNDVIEIFELPDFEENIISVLSNSIKDLSDNTVIVMYSNIDRLIEQNKNEKNTTKNNIN
jgi:hypothetical protein